MLTKMELRGEIQNIMRTLGAITFETSVVQNDMHELMLGILTEEIGDGGILRHRLMAHKDKLEIAFSFFNALVSKFSIEKSKNKEDEEKKCVGL